MRRHLLLLGLAAVAVAQPPPTPTTLSEQPFERIVELRVPPGVTEPKHSHDHGVTIALTAYDNEITTYPERTVTRRHTNIGEVRWVDAVTHEARNTGTTEQRVIRVEPKQPASTAPPSADPLDSLIVCKDTQTLILENSFVRVIQERVPPGVAQPKHRHRHGVLVPLADSDIESIDEGAQPVRRQLKFADATWREPVVHAVRNVGTTELLNIRVELK